jgi:hypothetical protein
MVLDCHSGLAPLNLRYFGQKLYQHFPGSRIIAVFIHVGTYFYERKDPHVTRIC